MDNNIITYRKIAGKGFVVLSCVIIILLSGCRSSKPHSVQPTISKISLAEMRREVEALNIELPDARAIAKEALTWLGTPYLYAGHSRLGTDCSGFVMEVFQKVLSLKLPRNSAAQREACIDISRGNMQPGDLVFFATGSSRDRVSHVGIYLGDGNIIHASSSRGVIVSHLDENYYQRTYHSAGRVDHFASQYSKRDKKNKNKQSKDSPQTIRERLESEPVNLSPIDESKLLDNLINQTLDSIFTEQFFD